MAQLYAVAGSKFYIGTKVAPVTTDLTLANFTGQVWTEVKGWTSAGALGDTQEVVSQAVISEKRTRQAKGTLAGGTMENTFLPDINDPGQIAFKAAIAACKPYAFKIEWGAGCAESGVVTMTIATPGVITWAGGHGLTAGSPISFATTGTLPTGIVAGTTYYVIAAGLTATDFSVAATPGGSAIATTGTQSGTHTATALPAGQTDLFYGLAMPGAKSGGDANTPQLRTWSVAIDSNTVEV